MQSNVQTYFKNYAVFTAKNFESMFAIFYPYAWIGQLKPGNCCNIAYAFLRKFKFLWGFLNVYQCALNSTWNMMRFFEFYVQEIFATP